MRLEAWAGSVTRHRVMSHDGPTQHVLLITAYPTLPKRPQADRPASWGRYPLVALVVSALDREALNVRLNTLLSWQPTIHAQHSAPVQSVRVPQGEGRTR